MIPLHDDNPVRTTPLINWLLIIVNMVVFVFTLLQPDPDAFLNLWGAVPADIVNNFSVAWPTLFTSMFLHAGLLHIGGNMLYLWIFGDNVEDILGHAGYLIFYILCGLAGGATHILSDPNSIIPAVGASGAISGVLGAYVRYFPKVRIRTYLGLFVSVRLPAFVLIVFWFIYQLLLATILTSDGGVAYWAHIGGFVFGLFVALLVHRRTNPG